MKAIIQTDRFSLTRLLAVYANDVTGQRKTLLTALGIGFFMFFIVEALSVNEYVEYGFKFAYVANNLKNVFPLTFIMIATVMASLMLTDCRTKEKRIAIIMLPALNLEKYLSRIMLVFTGIIAGILIHVALYYLLIAMHFAFQNDAMTLSGASSLHDNFLLPFGMPDITINDKEMRTPSILSLLSYAFIMIWVFSCYILGGTIWKKGSWLFTSGVLLITTFLYSGFVREGNNWIGFALKAKMLVSGFILNATVCTLLTALNIALSYYLFKRMQVTGYGLSILRGTLRHTPRK